jgi:hypothetical protein
MGVPKRRTSNADPFAVPQKTPSANIPSGAVPEMRAPRLPHRSAGLRRVCRPAGESDFGRLAAAGHAHLG